MSAGVKRGDTVAVVGDGAVGLSAVLASTRLGAERIVALSRHPGRQRVAREFGATHVVESRGEQANEAALELTSGVGVDAALECVGTQQSIDTAAAIARPGSTIGIVGVPHGDVPFNQTFFRNIGWRGGPAPARPLHPRTARRCSRRHDQSRTRAGLRNRPRRHTRGVRGDGRAACHQVADPCQLAMNAVRRDDELRPVGDAMELELASRRRDGALRPYVTMRVVRTGDDICGCSAVGTDNPRYRGPLRKRQRPHPRRRRAGDDDGSTRWFAQRRRVGETSVASRRREMPHKRLHCSKPVYAASVCTNALGNTIDHRSLREAPR